MMSEYFNCDCFLTHNIYNHNLNRHFAFVNSNQFHKEYHKILQSSGCDTEAKRELLLKEILEEIERRKSIEKSSAERQEYLKRFFNPSNKRLYKLQDNFLDPVFMKIIDAAKNLKLKAVLKLINTISEEKQLYNFPVFTGDFCNQLLKELHHYQNSSMPKGRPNSMNRYGVLIDELGFQDGFSNILRTEYLDPLAKALFPDWRGQKLDSHKIFTVAYKMGEDLELGYHYDNSEVTLNVCLGESFKGGEIYFGDMRTTPIVDSTCALVPHQVGQGIFHRGQQLHGALPISAGERHNLIIWLRSSSVRNQMCPMCNSKPKTLLRAVGFGDGFTKSRDFSEETCKVL